MFNPQEFELTEEMQDLNKAYIINVIREVGITEKVTDLQACLQTDQIVIKKKGSQWNGDWYISMEAALEIWHVEV